MSGTPRINRLVAEGVAIILSILVAFAIDAAWDRHLERQEELELIAGLEREFAANVEVLHESIALGTAGLNSLARFVRATPAELAQVPREDTWAQIAEPLMRSWTTSFSTGFLDATVSSGKLASIRDSHVRAGLAQYMGFQDDVAETAATMQRVNEEALMVMGGIAGFQLAASSAEPYSVGLDQAAVLEMAQHPDLRRLGAAKIPYWGAYLFTLKQLLAGAEGVLRLLGDAG